MLRRFIINWGDDPSAVGDQVKEILDKDLSCFERYEDKKQHLQAFKQTLQTMQSMLETYLEKLASDRIAQLEGALVDKELSGVGSRTAEAATKEPIKKQIYTTSEVMAITGIKTKATAIKYFKDGILKASQNPRNGQWRVKRTDLAEYLGTDDF